MEHNESETCSLSKEVEEGDDYLKSSDSGDLEKSRLWADFNYAHRKASFRKRYSKKIPSLRLHIYVTTANILLFIISGFMMWTSLRRNQTTLQDHWRATSYYCM